MISQKHLEVLAISQKWTKSILKDFESFKSNPITESITNEGNPQDNKIAVTLKYFK